ncbi:GGDEF domain-containing protein [Ruminococcus flavefaciens]|jgi:diguanylate cyclase (GGDEF)-like protein|uniref:GGDEF domain-containing protein n=1 Tax=Ruminococcus flavefaciens TaxID=1265 RepID=UPI0013DA18CE|nr:GGDEF domain-containing protein [Ruminococcus flavefaciens]
MAKLSSKKGSGGYIFAAILIAVIYVINTFLVENIYWSNAETSQRVSKSNNSLNRMNSYLSELNKNSLSIAAGVGNPMALIAQTDGLYANIQDAEKQFESIEGISPEATKRYSYAKAMIETYKKRLEALGTGTIESGDQNAMSDVMNFDLYSLQITASEMLTSTIDIVNSDTAKMNAKNTAKSYILMTVMMIVAILGEIAVWLFARRAKKARLELEEREMRLAEVDAKLKNTRQKASDLAVMNVLTGMKNRYALDNDISDRLESGRFQIAVFDMDNFRSINDTYGYDFGDEYLAAVAERLKQEFSDVAEIYNITGNEFCFVFNKNISESQATGIAQNIQRVMSSPYEVLNLTVQLPCSGAVYHYLPGDCLNVNSVLVKLDTAMRNAKMNGGNMITTVMNI